MPASCVAQTNFLAQNAAITTTTIYAVPANAVGNYRISWNAKITTADLASSTLGALTLVYTDPDNVAITITAGALISAGTVATTSTANTTSTVLFGIPLTINCKASTNITAAMAYASGTANVMTYNLNIKIEKWDVN